MGWRFYGPSDKGQCRADFQHSPMCGTQISSGLHIVNVAVLKKKTIFLYFLIFFFYLIFPSISVHYSARQRQAIIFTDYKFVA